MDSWRGTCTNIRLKRYSKSDRFSVAGFVLPSRLFDLLSTGLGVCLRDSDACADSVDVDDEALRRVYVARFVLNEWCESRRGSIVALE